MQKKGHLFQPCVPTRLKKAYTELIDLHGRELTVSHVSGHLVLSNHDIIRNCGILFILRVVIFVISHLLQTNGQKPCSDEQSPDCFLGRFFDATQEASAHVWCNIL